MTSGNDFPGEVLFPYGEADTPKVFDFDKLAQADHRWSKLAVGHADLVAHPKHTYGWVGCLSTAACMAVNALTGSKLTPPEFQAHALAKDAQAWSGVLINLERALRVFGLSAPDGMRVRSHIGDPALVALANACFTHGKACLLHVDHNSSLPRGDPFGDHFLFAYALVDGKYLCADPAPGSVVEVDAQALEGESKWGEELKHYRVVSVAPVWKP